MGRILPQAEATGTFHGRTAPRGAITVGAPAAEPCMTPDVNQVLAEIAPSFIRALNDRKLPTSLNLGLGEPSIPPDADLLEDGMRRYLAGTSGYTRNAGLVELREHLAAFRPELGVSPERMIITLGSQEAVFLSLGGLLNPGDEVVVLDPAFNIYGPIARLFGARAVSVPMNPDDGFALRADHVRAAITPRTKLICVVSPGNPTGRALNEQEARALAAIAEDTGVTLLVDEVYRELHHGAAPAPSPGQWTKRVITVGGLSKSCAMTGLRVGWAMLPENAYSTALKLHQLTTTCAATLCQYVGVSAFEHRALFRHRDIYRRRLDVTLSAIKENLGITAVRPEGAFYVFLDFRKIPMATLPLAEQLLAEEDVVMIPGEAFGPCANGFFRISFAQDDATVVEGIRRLGSMFKRRGYQP
jgi:aspartate/methionine/tyrosine aminotransferase